MTPIDKQSFGMAGCVVVIDGDSSPVGAYCAFQVIDLGTFTVVSASMSGINALDLPVGFVVYGLFTELTVGDGGKAIAYKASA